MACGGMSFTKNLKLKKNHFYLSHSIFSCYYCSIYLKRQSEHSGSCLDTNSLVNQLALFKGPKDAFSIIFVRGLPHLLFKHWSECYIKRVKPSLVSLENSIQ